MGQGFGRHRNKARSEKGHSQKKVEKFAYILHWGHQVQLWQPLFTVAPQSSKRFHSQVRMSVLFKVAENQALSAPLLSVCLSLLERDMAVHGFLYRGQSCKGMDDVRVCLRTETFCYK